MEVAKDQELVLAKPVHESMTLGRRKRQIVAAADETRQDEVGDVDGILAGPTSPEHECLPAEVTALAEFGLCRSQKTVCEPQVHRR